jgi:uncharacterized protein
MKKIIVLTIVLIVNVLASDVKFYNPSFDCSKVKENSIEYKICTNEKLSQLDENLSDLYKKVQKKYGYYIVKFYQQDWLLERSKCKTSECLLKYYEERVAKFKELEVKQMNKKDVWDVKLINSYSYSLSQNIDDGDYIIDTLSEIVSKNMHQYYNYYFFKNVHLNYIYKTRKSNTNKSTSEKKTETLISLQNMYDYPIGDEKDRVIHFSNGSVLSQLHIGGSPHCRGFYNDSDNFLLTNTDGQKREMILLMLLDQPVKVEGNDCEDGDFDTMQQKVMKVYPFDVYDLHDDTFLVIVDNNLGNKNKGYENYAIRFDSNLNSKSKLFGTKFFWLDVEEYKKMRKEYRKKHNYFTRKEEDAMTYEWIMQQKGEK